MKKLLIVLIPVFILLSSQTVFAKFPDVDSDFHQYEAINWLEEQGVVEGYSDGTFKPEQPVNRAEFMKMLFMTWSGDSMYGFGSGASVPYPDVPSNEWYFPFVKWADDNNIIDGYPDGTFKPANSINVAEAMKVVTNTFFDVDAMYDDGSNFTYCPTGFLDFDQLLSSDNLAKIDQNEWYWKYMHVAGELCLFDFGLNAYGVGGFWVDSYIDRGDMAELLYRAKTVKDNGNQYYTKEMTPN